jgi:type IV pilus assembly protein PilA
MYGLETSVLKAIQTLNTAHMQYNSQFGRYARSLTELGPSGSNLISTGSRTFYADQSLVIRQNYGPEPATANSRQVGSGL